MPTYTITKITPTDNGDVLHLTRVLPPWRGIVERYNFKPGDTIDLKFECDCETCKEFLGEIERGTPRPEVGSSDDWLPFIHQLYGVPEPPAKRTPRKKAV